MGEFEQVCNKVDTDFNEIMGIVSHLMKAVDQVRRDEIREKGKSHKELVTHTRLYLAERIPGI